MQARNPRTSEKVMVGVRTTVTFKPGQVMEERAAMERGGFVASAQFQVFCQADCNSAAKISEKNLVR